MAQGTNIDKLKRIRLIMVLTFVLGIPLLLLVVYFGFLKNTSSILPQPAATGTSPEPPKPPPPPRLLLDTAAARGFPTQPFLKEVKGYATENISAQRIPPPQEARLPRAHGVTQWAQGPGASSRKGPLPAHGFRRTPQEVRN